MKITVLSDGAWGTALALVLCSNGHEVCMWGHSPNIWHRWSQAGKIPVFCPESA